VIGSSPSAGAAPVSEGRFRRIAVASAGGAVVLALAALLALRGSGQPERSEEAFLQERASVLRLQLDLAKEDARYLLLDPDRGALTLYHGAVPLRSWPVLSVRAGARRLGKKEDGWRSRRWDVARIEPPVERERRVLVSDSVEPPDLTGSVDWIPPTPEEEVPTPPVFVVHYDGGMGLEVVGVEAASEADSLADSLAFAPPLLERVEHRLRRLLPRNWDRYRIRVTMPRDEAGRLYRSLPDSTSLLAVIPRH
jgi:hypothetical protein